MSVSITMSEANVALSENQFKWGGDGGRFRELDPGATGGRMLTIYAGEVIDAIQIGNDTHGRGNNNPDGGRIQAQATLPGDSYLTITKLVKRHMQNGTVVLTYFEALINKGQANEETIKAGTDSPNNSHGSVGPKDIWTGQLKVSIIGIQSGTFVDAILFQKV